jgi:hypothetical protein
VASLEEELSSEEKPCSTSSREMSGPDARRNLIDELERSRSMVLRKFRVLRWLLRFRHSRNGWVPFWPWVLLVLLNALHLTINFLISIPNYTDIGIRHMMKLLSSIRVRISPKDTKVVCSPTLLFFPVWVVLMRVEHNWRVL